MKSKSHRFNQKKIETLALDRMGLRDGSRLSTLGTHSRGFNSPQVYHLFALSIAGDYGHRAHLQAEAKGQNFGVHIYAGSQA